jgi:hypothetical protein
LKYVGALESGLTYLSWCKSGWFCHSDAIITQRNTIIEFLQEQIHDLILEADDAEAHIEELQQQPVPPAAPVVPEGGEEDPEEIEGVSDLDSEHGDPEPNPQPDYSSSGCQSTIGNLDDF